MGDIAGKVVVITGGTSGIGRKIAERCVAKGAEVVVCCRHEPHVLETIEALNTLGGGRAGGMQCDVTCFEEVHALFEYVADKFGGTHILINNAGVPQCGRLTEMAPFPEEWDYTLATNLTGAAYCSHEAIPQIEARGGGWVINIGALAATEIAGGDVAFIASKAGLGAFSKALMREVRHRGIRVGLLLPGAVDTAFRQRYPEHHGAILQPDDVADAVLSMLTAPERALIDTLEIRPVMKAA